MHKPNQFSYIRFEDGLRGSDPRYSRFNHLDSLEINAKNVIFIDSDFDSFGEDIRVVLVAPVIEVYGQHEIKLTGGAGETHYPSQAANGKGTSREEHIEAGRIVGVPVMIVNGRNGKGFEVHDKNTRQQDEVSQTNPNTSFNKQLQRIRSGQDGYIGRTGGSGGSFMAVGSRIVNALGLTIISNGGTGGRGQNGGDGADGNNCVVDVRRRCDWTSEVGGDGGAGGAGGPGGQPGRINIYAEKSYLVIQERKQGEQGSPGMGGHRGKGGQDANGRQC